MHNPLVTEKIEYNSKVDVAALKNKIVQGVNEYWRTLELGREIKQIVEELDAPKACLDKKNMEALELFENCGQVSQLKLLLIDGEKKRKKEYMKVYMKKYEVKQKYKAYKGKDEVKQRQKIYQKTYREKKKIMKRVGKQMNFKGN